MAVNSTNSLWTVNWQKNFVLTDALCQFTLAEESCNFISIFFFFTWCSWRRIKTFKHGERKLIQAFSIKETYLQLHPLEEHYQKIAFSILLNSFAAFSLSEEFILTESGHALVAVFTLEKLFFCASLADAKSKDSPSPIKYWDKGSAWIQKLFYTARNYIAQKQTTDIALFVALWNISTHRKRSATVQQLPKASSYFGNCFIYAETCSTGKQMNSNHLCAWHKWK